MNPSRRLLLSALALLALAAPSCRPDLENRRIITYRRGGTSEVKADPLRKGTAPAQAPRPSPAPDPIPEPNGIDVPILSPDSPGGRADDRVQ